MKGMLKFGERKPRTRISANKKIICGIHDALQLLIYSGFAGKQLSLCCVQFGPVAKRCIKFLCEHSEF